MIFLFKKAHHFFSCYYRALFYSLVLLFIFRPYARPDFLPIWKLLLTATLLSAVFNSNHHKFTRFLASVLAVPAIILGWMNIEDGNSAIFLANAIITILFLGICTISVLFDVILRVRFTAETLRGVVCAYFMVAFVFAYIFCMLEYFTPETFQFTNRPGVSLASYSVFLSEMLYFSFDALLCIGYGDIVAVKDTGQTAVILEGILGQFYIAILVARIVSVYALLGEKQAHQAEK